MYYVMDAHSFYNFIYFILLIIVSNIYWASVLNNISTLSINQVRILLKSGTEVLIDFWKSIVPSKIVYNQYLKEGGVGVYVT